MRKAPQTRKRSAAVFTMECHSSSKEVARVEPFLRTMNEAIRLDDGTMYRILVAATEAVNNAILHGNGSDPKKMVRMKVTVTPTTVKIEVRDEGKGFNIDSLPDPLKEENLMKEHGRGVFLIRSLMDQVSFRTRKNGSEIVMKVDLRRLRSA